MAIVSTALHNGELIDGILYGDIKKEDIILLCQILFEYPTAERYTHRNSDGIPIFNEYIVDKDGSRILIPLNSLEVEYYIHVKTKHVEVVNLHISKTDLPF